MIDGVLYDFVGQEDVNVQHYPQNQKGNYDHDDVKGLAESAVGGNPGLGQTKNRADNGKRNVQNPVDDIGQRQKHVLADHQAA